MGNTYGKGFTLIELSIVLVVIGLIVGGILIGQDLIKAAALRAQISQIEKYNSAVNTFREKFGALPGDMLPVVANQFYFTPRGNAGIYAGMGDGNGLIEGSSNAGCGNCNNGAMQAGEPYLFWNDLTWANGQNINLIGGTYNLQTNGATHPSGVTGTAINNWVPAAVIGQGNSIYAWSANGINYFGLSSIYQLSASTLYSNAGLTVTQAYKIDAKIDDGLPQSGNVLAIYIPTSSWYWAFNSFVANGYGGVVPGNAATASGLSCYDNGGNFSNPMVYSTAQNNGNGLNCALSFKMQGAGR